MMIRFNDVVKTIEEAYEKLRVLNYLPNSDELLYR